jgi:hypothetical protein
VPTLDDVYRKFGDVAEAAQLLETGLGTLLLMIRATQSDLFGEPNPAHAAAILANINRHTLGQLLRGLRQRTRSLDSLEELFWNALEERNRLFHSFYRQHNFRRNSDDGRALMLEDLEVIHNTILEAYKALLVLEGADLEALASEPLPTRHLPI